MNSGITSSESATLAPKSVTKFTVIYDDFATGLRAKRFADLIAAAIGEEAGHRIAPWRCEMLECDGLMDDAMRDAGESDYVIFSLRGDGSLSFAMKQWIEAWLERTAGRRVAIVALFDPERSRAGHAHGIRHYLRHVAGAAGVDFFSHCVVAGDKKHQHHGLDEMLPALFATGLLAA